MKLKLKDVLNSSGKNAELNTWCRYVKTDPVVTKEDSYIYLKTEDAEAYLGHVEEAVLSLVLDFTYVPAWIAEQWLQKSYVDLVGFDPVEVIKSWVSVGLVWCEGSVTGEYLRPTNFLYSLFGREPEKYSNIPFNRLTHEICEQQVMFEVLTGSGDNPINDVFKDVLLPRYSPLDIGPHETGTNVICERDFRPVFAYQARDGKDIEEVEYSIKQEAKAGEAVTAELKDFTKFVVVKKKGNTGVVSQDYDLHIPDLIVPALRDKGKPRSVAIEIELSRKTLKRYKHTLEKYKDNIKFGSLVWFSINGKVNDLLTQAYEAVGGLGSTEMYIFEFVVPSPSSIYKIK